MTATRKRAAKWVIGDNCRIVTPAFFVRCGYPIGFEDTVVKVMRDHGATITAFLECLGLRAFEHTGVPTKPFDKIAKAVAYGLVKRDGFGGKQRSIYTIALPDLAGVVTEVINIRYVKTGEYAPGWYGHEGDYDPPCLLNEKTHRILTTRLHHDEPPFWRLEIEDVHVTKVSE